MTDTITLTGNIATVPNAIITPAGLAITSFRLASSQRRFDRTQNKWVDGDTNWYTITAFRQLATNAAVSIKFGDPVSVTGRLQIKAWEANGKRGINVEVIAETIGHDLSLGTAAFSKSSGGGGDASAQAAQSSDDSASGFPPAAELEPAMALAGSTVGGSETPF